MTTPTPPGRRRRRQFRPLPPPGVLRTELGAGFADVAVLLPVAVELVSLNGLNPTTVFVGVGLMYLAGALRFRLPVPVQPLKAMAALALATGAGPALLGAAGVVMAAMLLLLSLPGPLRLIGRLFTRPVIRGVQLGVGLLLLRKAWALVGGALASWAVALFVLGLVLATARRWSLALPALLAASAALGWWHLGRPDLALAVGPVAPQPVWDDWSAPLLLAAFATLALPQLPLTLGNAVLATSRTAHDHFGPRARRVTPAALCRSLGFGNLAIGLFGGMPVCHGSGGMTAHVRFGARSGWATALFGVVLVAGGIVFGAPLVPLLHLVPAPVLGALLVPVGWAHAMLARDVIGNGRDLLIAATVGWVGFAAGSLLTGVAAGLAVSGLASLPAFRVRFAPTAWGRPGR